MTRVMKGVQGEPAPQAVISDVLDAMLDALADRIADRLAARTGQGTPRYATAKSNPIGSARAFLDAARARKFASFRRGREVCALWTDVEAWIESRRGPPRPPHCPPDLAADDRALLDAAGIRPRVAGKAGR